MNSQYEYLYNLISAILLMGITFYFLGILFPKNNENQKSRKIKILVVFGALCILIFLPDSVQSYCGVLQLLILLCASCLLYQGSFLEKLLYIFLQQFIYVAAAEVASGVIMIADIGQMKESILEDTWNLWSVMNEVFTYFLICSALWLVCGIWKRRLILSRQFCIFLIVGIGLSSACLIINVKLASSVKIEKIDIILNCFLPMVLYAFYIAFFLLVQKSTQLEEETKRVQAAKEYAMESLKYYERIKEQQLELRKLQHDMKNHLLVIRNQKESDHTYVDGVIRCLEKDTLELDSENGMADVIFWEKKKEAQKNKIEVDISVENTILKGYDEVSLCTILSNALDNAMEACMRLEGQRWIHIKGMRNSIGVILTIENPIEMDKEQRVNFQNKIQRLLKHQIEQLDSSKEASENHGFGISNIMSAVKELSGSMDISVEQDKFRISILLPLQEV